MYWQRAPILLKWNNTSLSSVDIMQFKDKPELDFIISCGKVINFLLPHRNQTHTLSYVCRKGQKFLVLLKLPHNLPELAINAYPQMMLHTQPIKKTGVRAICNNPTQKLIQKDPNLSPPDCPTLPQHKTQKPPIIVPGYTKQLNGAFDIVGDSLAFSGDSRIEKVGATAEPRKN